MHYYNAGVGIIFFGSGSTYQVIKSGKKYLDQVIKISNQVEKAWFKLSSYQIQLTMLGSTYQVIIFWSTKFWTRIKLSNFLSRSLILDQVIKIILNRFKLSSFQVYISFFVRVNPPWPPQTTPETYFAELTIFTILDGIRWNFQGLEHLIWCTFLSFHFLPKLDLWPQNLRFWRSDSTSYLNYMHQRNLIFISSSNCFLYLLDEEFVFQQ